jgi:hypothetical protein
MSFGGFFRKDRQTRKPKRWRLTQTPYSAGYGIFTTRWTPRARLMNGGKQWNEVHRTHPPGDVTWHQARVELSLALVAATGVAEDVDVRQVAD